MINFVCALTSVDAEVLSYISSLQKIKNSRVYVGVRSQDYSLVSNLKNVKIFEFDNKARKEAIISETVKMVKNGEMIILRRFDIDISSIEQMISSPGDIRLFKKEQLSFVKKIKKSILKIISSFFGLTLFNGDIGVIYLNNVACEVCKTLKKNGASFVTRINKWQGLSINYIELEDLKIYRPHELQKKDILKISLCCLFAVLSIICVAVVPIYIKISFWGIIGFVMLIIAALFSVIYAMFKLYLQLRIGELYFKHAVIINKGEK